MKDTAPTSGDGIRHRLVVGALVGAALLGPVLTAPSPALSQTIEGTLLDLNNDQPINLGLVLMFTTAGDSVAMTVTDEAGRFTLASPEAGEFMLLASALGYEETPAGVFELGDGASMTVEYRLEPAPFAMDELVVSLDRPLREHRLVRNGFVRRLQRGLGAFITPAEIEDSPATSTEQLLSGIPNVRVAPVHIEREISDPTGDALGGTPVAAYPRPDIGETVQIRAPGGGWCTPTMYVDGIRTFYDTDPTEPTVGLTLSSIAPLATVQGMEVYRRPAEIPVEYPAGRMDGEACGVLVVWTKSGFAPGRGPSGSFSGSEVGGEIVALPSVEEEGEAPERGERIRVQLNSSAAEPLGLTPTWEGTFDSVREDDLVAHHPGLGRAVAVPVNSVQALQVRRKRDPGYAVVRGVVAGAIFAGGTWLGLWFLCEWTCRDGRIDATIPAAVAGTVMGFTIYRQGPGERWVGSRMPEGTVPAVGVSLSVPAPGGR